LPAGRSHGPLLQVITWRKPWGHHKLSKESKRMPRFLWGIILISNPPLVMQPGLPLFSNPSFIPSHFHVLVGIPPKLLFSIGNICYSLHILLSDLDSPPLTKNPILTPNPIVL
jgi:hypothetical protein